MAAWVAGGDTTAHRGSAPGREPEQRPLDLEGKELALAMARAWEGKELAPAMGPRRPDLGPCAAGEGRWSSPAPPCESRESTTFHFLASD